MCWGREEGWVVAMTADRHDQDREVVAWVRAGALEVERNEQIWDRMWSRAIDLKQTVLDSGNRLWDGDLKASVSWGVLWKAYEIVRSTGRGRETRGSTFTAMASDHRRGGDPKPRWPLWYVPNWSKEGVGLFSWWTSRWKGAAAGGKAWPWAPRLPSQEGSSWRGTQPGVVRTQPSPWLGNECLGHNSDMWMVHLPTHYSPLDPHFRQSGYHAGLYPKLTKC